MGDQLIDSTLVKINARRGVIGINKELELFEGFDGRLYEAQPVAPDWVVEPLTTEEKSALADEMLRRWTAYRDAVAGPPDPAEEARRVRIVELTNDLRYVRDGEVEVNADAKLSEGDDNGCYVSGWVWCPFDGTEFDKEREE